MNPTMQKVALVAGVIAAAVLVNVGGYVVIQKMNAPKANQEAIQTPPPQPTPSSSAAPASKYPDTTLEELGFKPNFTESDVTLAQAPNYQNIKTAFNITLTSQEEDRLTKEKSVLIPLSRSSALPRTSVFDEMLVAFDTIGGSSSDVFRLPENTVLVTPDIALHAYHKFFEMTLEELEKKELAELLGQFLDSLWDNLATQAKSGQPTIRARAQVLLAQLAVARTLFDTKNSPKPSYFDSPEDEEKYSAKDEKADTIDWAKKNFKKYSPVLSADLAKKTLEELELIYKAEQIKPSPLFGEYKDDEKADYTQYTPRSHYSKTSRLRSYFRTMMYLGRNSIFFKKDLGIGDAQLIASQFTVTPKGKAAPIEPWKKIMEITGFYAGKSDDITHAEWMEVLGKIGDPSVENIRKNIKSFRLPRILSSVVVSNDMGGKTKDDLLRESLGFRIFGQRFTYDAWILNQLTSGQEQSEARLPSLPSALYVPTVFGDARAKEHIETILTKERGLSVKDLPGFFGKLDEVAGTVSKELLAPTAAERFSSMGAAWLDLLSTLTNAYGTGYPRYMQVVSFLDKQIQTFLGSYTELKHDTLLYAKQSYAELGGGGAEDTAKPPIAKGLVEPNVLFWRKLENLVNYTQQLFEKNNLFQDHSAAERLTEFSGIVESLKILAEKELKGEPLTEEEYEKIRTLRLAFMGDPFDSAEQADETTGRVALVADIHTDAVGGDILYEATGEPYLMLTLVANEGSPRVVIGVVFNHYEFTAPLGGKRVTDEDWKEKVYEKPEDVPPKNFWYDSLLQGIVKKATVSVR